MICGALSIVITMETGLEIFTIMVNPDPVPYFCVD